MGFFPWHTFPILPRENSDLRKKIEKYNEQTRGKLIIPDLANFIQSVHKFTFEKGEYWLYNPKKGVWVQAEEFIMNNRIREYLMTLVPDKATPDMVANIRRTLEDIVREQTSKRGKNQFAHMINVKNGMLDPMSGKLYAHNPHYYSFYQIPIDYDRNAECPMWDEFTQYAFDGQKELITLLHRFIAYVISDIRELQFYMHLIGGTGTGKSTIQNTIWKLIGEDKCTTLSLANAKGNQFFLQSITGKKFVVIAEMDEQHLDSATVSMLKNITGFDPVYVNKKHKEGISYQVEFKTMVVSNNFPQLTDFSGALFRRMLLMAMDKTISRADGSKWFGSTDNFNRELSGIFSRHVIPAFRDVVTMGAKAFIKPNILLEWEMEIQRESNQILQWVHDCCEIGPFSTHKELQSILFDSYISWFERVKKRNMSRLDMWSFGKKLMQSLGTKIRNDRTRDGMMKLGIKLKPKDPIDVNGFSNENTSF